MGDVLRSGALPRVFCALLLSVMAAACDGASSLKEALNTPASVSAKADSHKVRVTGATLESASSIPMDTKAARGDLPEKLAGLEQRGTGNFLDGGRPFAKTVMKSGEEGITLNLLNVPIAQAAKTVLSDALGASYTVSEKVVGNITIQTTQPISKGNLIDAFEAALRSNGAALARVGEMYSIVPSAELGDAGLSLDSRSNQGRPGVSVQVISLEYIAASEMKRLIEPIAHRGAVVKADDRRSILVLSGTGRELAETADLIRLFDVDWMKGMSVAILPVRTSDPELICGELETIFGIDGKEAPLKGVVRFVPNQRLGAILVIATKPTYLDKAREWIEKLDRTAELGERQLFVYKIQNRAAAELANILQRLLSTPDETSSADQQNVGPRFEPTTGSTSQLPPELGVLSSQQPTGTGAGAENAELGTLGNAPPPSGLDSGSARKTKSFEIGKLRIVADEPNNALLIDALPKEYERILKILNRIDVQPTQVMLEAVIAEVTLNDELKFGLKWYFEKKNSSFTLSDAVNGAVASSFPGFSYFFSASNVQVALDALSGVTKVNVVSAPSLMALDNRKATLQIGDQVPIITQTAQSVTNPDAPVVNAVTLKDTGVILSVTPRVNDAGRVVLHVEQEVSNVARTTSSGIDSPTIQQRKVETTVVVSDGEVLALGGLIQQRDVVSKTQIPILGDLPVVGTAFRQKEDTIDRTELVIFIRPLVVRNSHEARAVTEEFRSRFNMRPLQPTRGERHYERDLDRIVR